ncbi:DUF3576 domain-containing protein [Candidatus Pelagibacter sp.]|nr:DUF3576 domain-containing protein [Candidatus Pelagibacter sp.]
MKKIYSLDMKNIFQSILLIFIAIYLNSCGIYRPVDARKVSPNANERVKQNQKEGKGVTFGSLLGKNKGGDFQFASSNPMWRATIEILDFVPLSNVDYGGGVIVTDWYKNSDSNQDSIKIMIQFLTNEIRSDGIKINIYKKKCVTENNCSSSLLNSNLNGEIKLAILKKAALLKKESIEKKN